MIMKIMFTEFLALLLFNLPLKHTHTDTHTFWPHPIFSYHKYQPGVEKPVFRTRTDSSLPPFLIPAL